MRAIRDWPHLVGLVVHCLAVALAIVAFERGHWVFLAAAWLLIAWLQHAALARLHEAVHGMLSRRRWWNEAQGMLIGWLAWTPLHVYRYVHKRHHAYLGGRRDPEFWPYNQPEQPLGRRRRYAAAELLLGFLVTPALYSLRTARCLPSLRPNQRRWLAAEWTVSTAGWVAVIALAIAYDWWPWLLVGHVVPAWLTGIAQTLRKFLEHLGRFGHDIPTMTRTVQYRGWFGRLLSLSQLNVDHHGTHHRWPRIPYRNLPAATELMFATSAESPYRHHGIALLEALRAVPDPRVGPQWHQPTTPIGEHRPTHSRPNQRADAS